MEKRSRFLQSKATSEQVCCFSLKRPRTPGQTWGKEKDLFRQSARWGQCCLVGRVLVYYAWSPGFKSQHRMNWAWWLIHVGNHSTPEMEAEVGELRSALDTWNPFSKTRQKTSGLKIMTLWPIKPMLFCSCRHEAHIGSCREGKSLHWLLLFAACTTLEGPWAGTFGLQLLALSRGCHATLGDGTLLKKGCHWGQALRVYSPAVIFFRYFLLHPYRLSLGNYKPKWFSFLD